MVTRKVKAIDQKYTFLKNQSHEQLEMIIMNEEHVEQELRKRLMVLTGCGDFGNSDGTIGDCVNCSFNRPDQFNRCDAFRDMMKSFETYDRNRKEYRENEK